MIVVVGLGLTGISCVRFLVGKGVEVRAFDTRENPPKLEELRKEFPQVDFALGKFPVEWLEEVQEMIVSPGVSVLHPELQQAQKKGIVIRGDIDLFAQYAQAPIVGVTGSNGKSTVVSWLADMGERAGRKWMLGGNIGTAALDLLNQSVPDLYILELSSFQLETTYHLPLRAAAILNITPDHLDRYPDLAAYTEAKHRIYHECETAVFYRAQPETKPAVEVKQLKSFGLDVPPEGQYGVMERQGEKWLAVGDNAFFPVSEMQLKGSQNVLNALACVALGEALGLSLPEMRKSLQQFSGLPHRCQFVAQANGVQWINDSKGTNVGATLAAIEGLATGLTGKLVMILGGDGKEADFSSLVEPLQRYARCAVVLGQDAYRFEALLKDVLPVYRVNNLQEAVRQSAQCAQPKDTVLLSPACSSLDMFENYGARGDEFMQTVKEWIKKQDEL